MILQGSTITVTLPDDLVWEDEFTWQPVLAQAERSLAGTLVVQTSTMVGGRPITLVGDSEIWIDKSTLQQLIDLVNANEQMSLTLPDSRNFTVVFRYEENPVIEFRPIAHNIELYADLRIKLREV